MVGVLDGTIVDGSSVGKIVGFDETSGDGFIEGDIVGVDGLFEGLKDGSKVGVTDGPLVGVTDG